MSSDFGTALLVAGACYVAVLLVIAGISRKARREETLSDFYLAGRSLGPMVLLLTLFATQYSGNSLSGFPGQTYREGLAYYMSVTFMTAIVAGYLLFAPGLYRAARKGRFVTPTDFLAERFGSPTLNGLSTAIFSLTLVNFLLAQLMAMGHAFEGLTGGQVPYAAGVIGGAVVILVYELLGGMRAVAWTDALQGILLALGLGSVLILLTRHVGSPAAVVQAIAESSPEKAAVPDAALSKLWLSNLLLIGLGAPLYPQAIQRIYAARRAAELKRALAVMALLPHFAISTVIFIGLVGITWFPGLERAESDQVTFKVLARLVEVEPLAFVPVLGVMLAVVAAIMSTADSCLLSLSSILTRDVVGRLRRQDAQPVDQLSGTSAWLSIAVMVVLVTVAIRPLTTLWDLLVLKFEILIQLSPAFLLGTGDRGPKQWRSEAIVAGLIVGLATALTLFFAGTRAPWGFHAGVVGLAANYLVVWVVQQRRTARSS